MLYRILLKIIEKKRTDDLEEKIDIFYATGKLTEKEYKELISLLKTV